MTSITPPQERIEQLVKQEFSENEVSINGWTIKKRFSSSFEVFITFSKGDSEATIYYWPKNEESKISQHDACVQFAYKDKPISKPFDSSVHDCIIYIINHLATE